MLSNSLSCHVFLLAEKCREAASVKNEMGDVKWGTLLPSDLMKDIPFNKPHHGLSFLKKHPDIKINKFYPFNKKCR